MIGLSGLLGTVGSIFGPVGTAVGGVVGTVVDTVKDGYDKRQQVKQAEFDAKMKLITTAADVKAQMMINQQQGDIAWENIHAGKDFWGKDAWTVLCMAAVIAIFVPESQGSMLAGMRVLTETPVWFQALMGGSWAVSFSIRKFVDLQSTKRGAAFQPLVSQEDVDAINKVSG